MRGARDCRLTRMKFSLFNIWISKGLALLFCCVSSCHEAEFLGRGECIMSLGAECERSDAIAFFSESSAMSCWILLSYTRERDGGSKQPRVFSLRVDILSGGIRRPEPAGGY